MECAGCGNHTHQSEKSLIDHYAPTFKALKESDEKCCEKCRTKLPILPPDTEFDCCEDIGLCPCHQPKEESCCKKCIEYKFSSDAQDAPPNGCTNPSCPCHTPMNETKCCDQCSDRYHGSDTPTELRELVCRNSSCPCHESKPQVKARILTDDWYRGREQGYTHGYQEGVKAEREKNEAGMYHSQGKSCCYLNPCGCVCHNEPPAKDVLK